MTPAQLAVEEAVNNPHCGCWDKCKCGGGDKAVLLAAEVRRLRKIEEAARNHSCAMGTQQLKDALEAK